LQRRDGVAGAAVNVNDEAPLQYLGLPNGLASRNKMLQYGHLCTHHTEIFLFTRKKIPKIP
jgi:hypothetical protein